MEKLRYHRTLSFYFSAQPLFFDGDLQKKPHIRKCVELPFQQTKAQLWDEVTDTLCNLDFIQAKACAKMTYDLVKDYNAVLQVIPDNAENISQEEARQARMEKYTRDLIAYAKGEIKELEVPETVPLWSEKKINSEIERIKTNPNRLDHLKDFKNFLGHEAGDLQNYAHEFPHFATQQAWNYADSGPVSQDAEKSSYEILKLLLLKSTSIRPEWEPLPQVMLTLKGHSSNVRAVAITPNGKKAISVSGDALSGFLDKMCILWDLKTGQSIYMLNGHYKQVNSVALTPDGKYAISGSADKTCIIWDLTYGQIIHRLTGHTNIVTAVAITPDGNKAISGSMDKTCIIWDLKSGKAINTLHGHSNEVTAVAITPDGNKAVSSDGKSIYFDPLEFTCITWDLKSGGAIHTLKGHNNPVLTLSITPDGKRAITGSSDKTCIIWDLILGKAVYTLKGHTSSVRSVSITPDGNRAISGSSDKTCIIWNLATDEAFKTLRVPNEGINSIDITPDGTKAIIGSGDYLEGDHICLLCDLNIRQERNIRKGHMLPINIVAISPDCSKVITGSDDSEVIIWDINTGQKIQNLKGHTSSIKDLSITHNGKRAVSVSREGTCITWDLASGKSINIIESQVGSIFNGMVTPDEQRAISQCSSNTWIFWDLCSGKVINTLKWNYGPFVISSDGKMTLFGSGPRIGQIRDLNTDSEIITHTEHTSYVRAVTITPDGKIAISGSDDKSCIIWDLRSSEKIYTLRGHNDSLHIISVTQDGRRVITGSWDHTFAIWNLKTGQEIHRFKGHTSFINSITITPDGGKAISISRDKSCIVWDLNNGKQLARLVTISEINSLAFSLNCIVLGCKSGELIIINTEIGKLPPKRSIVSIRYIWDFELRQYLPLSADCPICGHRFSPSALVLASIEEISRSAGIRPEQSPCLKLPDEAWEDPGLLGNCPKCRAELKFNPFFAGGDN